jgi:uncharacterized protein
MPIKDIYHALLDSSLARWSATALARALPEPHIGLTFYDVALPGLPPQLTGLRLLHISDLHLRPGSELALELPELAATVPHDFTVYTGDFIDTDEAIEAVGRVLERMPRADGVFAVLGNHDYLWHGRNHCYNDAQQLRSVLREAGVDILSNSSRPVCGGELFIAGVDDPAIGRDDLSRAYSAVPAGACSLLLAHSPDIVLRLGQHRPGLVLAGHTHGGQVRLPIVGAVHTESKMPRRLAMGLNEHRGTQVFVSRGVGYSGLDIRIGCPPEVALITLRSPLAAEHAA